MKIEHYQFNPVCKILPDRDSHGLLVEDMPHDRYDNHDQLPLHQYGKCPFCRFRIPDTYHVCGVYALVVNQHVLYIGECVDLSKRYNMGYGQISPRNPFQGGQQTNCRINTLILAEIRRGSEIDLWFMATERYKEIELELRQMLNPMWNMV